MDILLIPFSACLAETITFPIEYVKIRMHIEKKYKNIYTIFNNIYKQPNITIYNGIKPALMRQSVYALLRLSIYKNLREKQISNNNNINKICIGAFTGFISQIIVNPLDLLKVQCISSNQKNIYQNFINIVKNNGIIGLWKGCSPSILRSTLHNVGSLPSYDISKSIYKKKFLIDESTKLHVMSSLTSGFISSILSTPADVIKSKLMSHDSQYKNISDCLYNVVKREGITSLYRGFFLVWMRLAPWQLTFWVTYEKLRYFSNIEHF